ncbi:carboxymuconolactone decarboxylase family protein [Pigmentiphaga sp.]|uniref:carboxymuconolactone decarboxylase family protein n=1 Tax=Pigmentiphaga sp. TaxID=1977564 RepID=UPI0039B8D7F3
MQRRPELSRSHARLARKSGVTPEEMIDAMTTAILSGGVPGWIEGSKAFIAGAAAVSRSPAGETARA